MFSDRIYRVSSIPDQLVGSKMFQMQHKVSRSTITVSSSQYGEVVLALSESQDGSLMDVLPSEGWNFKKGWSVVWPGEGEANVRGLNKVYSKPISAGRNVTFTSTKDEMTCTIFVVDSK